jgi:hypothetical protein
LVKDATKKSLEEQAEGAEKALKIFEAEVDGKNAIRQAELDIAQGFGILLQQVAGKNKGLARAGVIIEQAAAIGRIISNTAAANAKAVAASPLTGGMPWVALNTASAAISIASSIASANKAIQQINQVQTGGADSGVGRSSLSSGASVSALSSGITAPTTGRGMIQEMNVSGIGGESATSQIANTIRGAFQPVRAYVVGQDITSQQQLDRRTTTAATLGG